MEEPVILLDPKSECDILKCVPEEFKTYELCLVAVRG